MPYSSLWNTVEQDPYSLGQRNRRFTGVAPQPAVRNIPNPMFDPTATSPFAGGMFNQYVAPVLNQLPDMPSFRTQVQYGRPAVGTDLNARMGNGITMADANAAFGAGQPSMFSGAALPEFTGLPQIANTAPATMPPTATIGATAPTDPMAAMYATEFNMTPGINANGAVDPNSINMTGVNDSSGMFSDMTGADWMGFGAGLLNTGVGAYFQNRQMGLAEDELALSQAKFDTYLADRQRLLDADKRRVAASGG